MKINQLKNPEITYWALDHPELVEAKLSWGDGPWQKEYDRVVWFDQSSGYPCCVSRNPEMGFFAGYVGVPYNHYNYGLNPDHLIFRNKYLGVEWSGMASKGYETYRPYIEMYGSPVYWFGFDAAHAGDLIPSMNLLLTGGFFGAKYRTLEEMIQACNELAIELLISNMPYWPGDDYK